MSQSPTLWQRVKTGGKSGFDVAYKAVDKLGAPVNKLSNKLGSEAFWPTTLDKESDKAARILKTFCKDGFYTEEEYETEDGPKQKQRVIKKIPTEVIKNAKGLAIFTTMRTGLWVSGAGGSGILIARKDDGTWSPPSGILLHTAGLGFLVGVDIYDCVVVINTAKALEAFTSIRCTLGGEISVVAGPVGAGGVLESELHKRQAPVFTYMKSRGFYAGVQIDGTVIIERGDENEAFYGQRISVADILAGKVRHPPYEVRRLLETIKAAQGDSDVDEKLLPTEPPPGDYEIDDGHMFGVPEKDDPDPYGVLALEKEGLSIKEAGTHKRASWEAFSFNPSPTSPIHTIYARNSTETPGTPSRRNSWRTSAFSEARTPSSLRTSMEFPPPPSHPSLSNRASTLSNRASKQMSDSGTQTDDLPEDPSLSRPLSMRSAGGHSRNVSSYSLAAPMQEVPEHNVLDTSPERKDTSASAQANGYTTPPRTPEMQQEESREDTPDIHDEDAHIEEPVIQSVQSVQSIQPVSPQVINKARLVTVPKRGPPPVLPPRNPHRGGPIVIDASPKPVDSIGPADIDDVEIDSKHDSAQEVVEERRSTIEEVKQKMDDVRLHEDNADDEDEDIMKANPWAKVEEIKRKQDEEQEQKQEPSSPQDFRAMPGGFQ